MLRWLEAEKPVTANGKAQYLKALGDAATKLSERLGESTLKTATQPTTTTKTVVVGQETGCLPGANVWR